MTNRVCLITGVGAENGIGYAAAKALAGRGYSLLLVSHSDRAVRRARDLKLDYPDLAIHGFSCDLTEETEVTRLFEKIEQLSSSGEEWIIDVLVNNAGMTSVTQSAEEAGESEGLGRISVAGWEASLRRNLTSAFLVTRMALPYIRKSRAGRIINVSSVTGPVMAMSNEAGYAAAKAGMVGMTRALALDEARHGITVNAISPGWIATESQTTMERENGRVTPLGRSGIADEIASAVEWLASRRAGYITGQNIVIDGGNSIAEERVC